MYKTRPESKTAAFPRLIFALATISIMGHTAPTLAKPVTPTEALSPDKAAASSAQSQLTPPKGDGSRSIPLKILAGAIEPIHGEDPTLPDELLARSRGKTLEGSYKICISAAGHVNSVTPVVSIAGADRAVISTLKTWKYPTIGTDICKIQTLSFEVK